jgi:galactokinase
LRRTWSDASSNRATVAAAFREFAGRDPDGVWWAPGRVNLIGEHTDYNDGLVLPFAIPRGTYAAVARRADGRLRCLSLEEGPAKDADAQQAGPGRSDGWSAYVHGVVWALREAGFDVGGADVVVATTLTRGGGLSSSAALECSVALALGELNGTDGDRVALARAAQRAENDAVGVPTGLMDQLASLLGRADHALFVDMRSLETRHVRLALAGPLRLLVVDTRVRRRLGEGAYGDRRRECERAARELGVESLRDVTPGDLDDAGSRMDELLHRRVRHVVTENERVRRAVAALEAARLEELGALLSESHRSLRDDYQVSSPELDLAVDAAVAAGAYGARMTGGGFGGCALACVPAERAGAVADAVHAAFAAGGLAEPEVFEVKAAEGARRVE